MCSLRMGLLEEREKRSVTSQQSEILQSAFAQLLPQTDLFNEEDGGIITKNWDEFCPELVLSLRDTVEMIRFRHENTLVVTLPFVHYGQSLREAMLASECTLSNGTDYFDEPMPVGCGIERDVEVTLFRLFRENGRGHAYSEYKRRGLVPDPHALCALPRHDSKIVKSCRTIRALWGGGEHTHCAYSLDVDVYRGGADLMMQIENQSFACDRRWLLGTRQRSD